ncbi:MAG: Ig-like domain-containing domain, partial [Planctomycetota bacterium]
MGFTRTGRAGIVCALAIAVSSCSGGGGGSAASVDSGSPALLTDLLEVTSQDPVDDALQVAVSSSITIEFDGTIASECLEHEDTWLRKLETGDEVPLGYSVLDSGHRVVFTPGSPLEEETDYVFQLSALTCDRDGRLLEEDFSFEFRSLDSSPPNVLGTSIVDGASNVANTADIRIDFDEVIDLASADFLAVRMLDLYGDHQPLNSSLDGKTLILDPIRDLAGNRSYTLELSGGANGLTDRAGNALAADFVLRFSTAADLTAPTMMARWPNGSHPQSPGIEPRITFSESVDRLSVETNSLSFVDEFANIIPYFVVASSDYKTLTMVPYDELVVDRGYTISLASGPGAITDLSGNPLATPSIFNFQVGNDLQAPQLLAASPADAATRVSPNVQVVLSFSEALDPATVNEGSVELTGPEGSVTGSISLQAANQQIAIVPDGNLSPGTRYEVVVRGTHEGLRDLAGNPFLFDQTLSFTTSDDASTPSLQVWPRNGETTAPIGVHLSILSSEALDPGTVHSGLVYVKDEWGTDIAGDLSLSRSDRLIRFVPTSPWLGGTTYEL